MLHYSGSELAMHLGEAAREYIWMYHDRKSRVVYVPFIDEGRENKKRFVKFEILPGVKGWTYVDLVDQTV